MRDNKEYVPGLIYETGRWREHELYNVFPWLSPFYTRIEKDFNMDKGMMLLRDLSPWFPIGICIVYLMFCYVGTIYMKNRKPFKLNSLLLVWNALLAVFSIFGAVRTVPHLIHVILTEGFMYTIAGPGKDWCGGGAIGLWCQFFVFSKVPELGDTVFIILRKKPLIFLHWYHHVTVLLFTWHSYYFMEAYSVYFAAMNYSVHAVMYLYYALATQKIRLCKPQYVTFIQISQMFLGIAVCCSCWYYYMKGHDENVHIGNLWAAAIMYASYAFLFLQYAVMRFIKKVLGNENRKQQLTDKDAKKGHSSDKSKHSMGSIAPSSCCVMS